jgi:hypothetical protein
MTAPAVATPAQTVLAVNFDFCRALTDDCDRGHEVPS